jgi:hypothetical protein
LIFFKKYWGRGLQVFSFSSLLLVSMAVDWKYYQVLGDSRTRDKDFDEVELNTFYCFNVSDFLEMTEVYANVI